MLRSRGLLAVTRDCSTRTSAAPATTIERRSHADPPHGRAPARPRPGRHGRRVPTLHLGDRYGRGAIMITTNKSVRDWTELLAGDEVLAAAILDRLLHRAHVLNIKGRSYRLRDLEDALKLSHA